VNISEGLLHPFRRDETRTDALGRARPEGYQRQHASGNQPTLSCGIKAAALPLASLNGRAGYDTAGVLCKGHVYRLAQQGLAFENLIAGDITLRHEGE
jgi:hypothetical protein